MSATKQPNVLIIITDQQRYFQHWDALDEDSFLPSMGKLKQNGIIFENCYIAAAMCSPSRAAFLTSSHASQNGVPQVGGSLNTPAGGNQPNSNFPNMPNLCQLMNQAGYNVAWKGKWHLGASPEYTESSLDQFLGSPGQKTSLAWDAPDAGIALGDPTTLGGADANNDGRYEAGFTGTDYEGEPTTNQTPTSQGASSQSAKDFLKDYANGTIDNSGPFCLIASFVNPHDCHAFTNHWIGPPSSQGFNGRFDPGSSVSGSLLNPAPTYYEQTGSFTPPATTHDPNPTSDLDSNLSVTLPAPPNYPASQPDASVAPYDNWPSSPINQADGSSVDSETAEIIDYLPQAQGQPGDHPGDAQLFVNWYAYLQQVADQEICDLLYHLDTHGLADDTIVIRFSDHGEQAQSHGFREKSQNPYEETTHVPFIVSNPAFERTSITEVVSLLDLVPTVADLAGASATLDSLWGTDFPVRGTSLASFIPPLNDSVEPIVPAAPIHPYGVLFSYDDLAWGGSPSTVRAVVWVDPNTGERWKYAIFFDPSDGSSCQYALYQVDNGDNEVTNLADVTGATQMSNADQWKTGHKFLLSLMSNPEWYQPPATDPPLGPFDPSEFPVFPLSDSNTYMVNAMPTTNNGAVTVQITTASAWNDFLNNVTPAWWAAEISSTYSD